MTEKLASRIAGLKLGGIVAILMIPMLVLSFLMVTNLHQDIAFAEREKLGANMVELLSPVMLKAAVNQYDEDAFERLRGDGAALAEKLKIMPQMTTAIAGVITYTSDRRYTVGNLQEVLRANQTASNIILDPFAETYFLGAISTQHMPDAIADYTRLVTLESRIVRDGVVTFDELGMLIKAVGSWQESLDRAMEGVQQAAEASGDTAAFATQIDLMKELDAHASEAAKRLMTALSAARGGAPAHSSVFADSGQHVVDDMRDVWAFSVKRFDAGVSQRIENMRFKLNSLLATALAACLIGVGGAAIMFLSTLRRLDDVKLARDEADAARQEAELAAAELQKVNEDVILLNADLSRNIKLLRETQDENLKKGKMAQLGHLTATVAHELRNPLGAVRTSLFLLERKLKGKELGVEPQLERINNGVTRCDNIISQLLDFARTKALNTEQIVFDDWLVSLVEEEAQKLPAVVGIECSLGLAGVKTSIDPGRMNRVIINLLTNASEALVGKGEDPSKFASKTPQITVSSRQSQRGIEVSVKDNGPGIPPDIKDRIFEPLFTTKNFGTGLGLAAVLKVLEQHGGGLEVRSEPGHGATFIAWWPHATDTKEAA
ncbi:MAG: HAMP domain-containing histidine kinase [Alphaproteobacteria bacterium]|nr:HAMP domain-containing histidine kinase [Alphaproteobacteria bacterium]